MLDQGLLPLYKKTFQKLGGEQFRPNTSRVQCRRLHKCVFRSERLADTTRRGIYQQHREAEAAVRGGKSPVNCLLLLADEGIDLSNDWYVADDLRCSKGVPFSCHRFRERMQNHAKIDYQRRDALQEKIADHRRSVIERFPYLDEEEILYGTVALGSGYSRRNKQDPEFHKFCNYELDLRVGIGHEQLHELRTALSLSYRKTKAHGTEWGVENAAHTNRAQKKASRQKQQAADAYCANWKIVKLLINSPWLTAEDRKLHVRGLRELDRSTDVKYCLVQGKQTQAFMVVPDGEMSWIWDVPMLGSSTSSDPAIMQKAIEEWVDEGESSALAADGMINNLCSTTINLGACICESREVERRTHSS